MKVTREQLKRLIKECLIELLNDGLGNLSTPPKQLSLKQQPSPIRDNSTVNRLPTAALREAVKQESKGDPVLASILADTAKTTLPQMLANEHKAPLPVGAGASVEQHIVSQTTPEELFGEESASRWADLAFMDQPAKKTA